MLKPIKKYTLVVSNSDKAQLFDNRKEIAKVFLAPTLYELDGAITSWYANVGLQDVLNTLDFIPCIKEAEIAYMKEELSEADLRSYMDDIVSEIKKMRTADLYYYTFDDYKEYAESFDCSVQRTIMRFIGNQEEIIEWIISDDRLDDFGEALREEFCKWLSDK